LVQDKKQTCPRQLNKIMENNEDRGYGLCGWCGVPNVKSPKTGKIFCSKMCWKDKKNKVEKQDESMTLESRIASMEYNLGRLVMILECIYPEMLKERERREGVSEERKI
jgi:uncharacterized Zn finger protein (UPF0148 family)